MAAEEALVQTHVFIVVLLLSFAALHGSSKRLHI